MVIEATAPQVETPVIREKPSQLQVTVDRVRVLRSDSRTSPKGLAEAPEVRHLSEEILRQAATGVRLALRKHPTTRFYLRDLEEDMLDIAANTTIYALSQLDRFNPHANPQASYEGNFEAWINDAARRELLTEVDARSARSKAEVLYQREQVTADAPSGQRLSEQQEKSPLDETLDLLFTNLRGKAALRDILTKMGVSVATPQDLRRLFVFQGDEYTFPQDLVAFAQGIGLNPTAVTTPLSRFRHTAKQVLAETLDAYSTREISQMDEFSGIITFKEISDALTNGRLQSFQFLGRSHYITRSALRDFCKNRYPVTPNMLALAYTPIGANATTYDAAKMKSFHPESVILYGGKYYILNTIYQDYRQEFPDQRENYSDNQEVPATRLLSAEQYNAVLKTQVRHGIPPWARKEGKVYMTTRQKLREAGIIQ